jgi:4-amino-4-deoxy-L-arabinose transferase-like glycosyltransferase
MTGSPRRDLRDFMPGPGWRGRSGPNLAADWIERLGPWVGLIALCLALYLPGLSVLPPFDRDEARFAEATKQMLETGDYVRIEFQNEARNKKPIGAYWAEAASAELFGGAAAPLAAYRLPSALAALAAALMLYAGGRILFDPRTAFIAASLLATSLTTVIEAHLAKTDALLLAATVAAQMALALIYVKRDVSPRATWARAMVFWAAIGIGVLIKGPVVPLISALTIAALCIADRSWRWLTTLKPLAGLPLAVLITAPWFIAIQRATDGAFLAQAVGNDLLPKLLGAQESHGSLPGTYLALLSIGFFPGSLFVWPALAKAWRKRILPAERFCLAWVVPAWVMFELVPTKLPHYVLPLYPALALLTARFIVGIDGAKLAGRVTRSLALVGWVVWTALAVTLAAAAVALPGILHQDWASPALAPALLLLAATIGTLIQLRRKASIRAIGFAIGGTAVFAAMVLQTVLPSISELWLSRSAAQMVQRAAPAGAEVAATGYAEPSLVFLLGSKILLGDPEKIAHFLRDHERGLALVGSKEAMRFHEIVQQDGVAVEAVDHRRGFNYSNGKWVDLTLYRRVAK